MMHDVATIPTVIYANTIDGVQYDCEPSADDIQRAIDEKQFEFRGFQTHHDELMDEWKNGASSAREFNELMRAYHTRRIAHFVDQGWNDPIILTVDGKMKDGLHRLKAAIFKGMGEVEVTIADDDPE